MSSTSRASSKSGHQSAAVVPAGHSAVVRDRLKATPSTISEDASAERMAAAWTGSNEAGDEVMRSTGKSIDYASWKVNAEDSVTLVKQLRGMRVPEDTLKRLFRRLAALLHLGDINFAEEKAKGNEGSRVKQEALAKGAKESRLQEVAQLLEVALL